jgi:transcription elongation factor Elf1
VIAIRLTSPDRILILFRCPQCGTDGDYADNLEPFHNKIKINCDVCGLSWAYRLDQKALHATYACVVRYAA